MFMGELSFKTSSAAELDQTHLIGSSALIGVDVSCVFEKFRTAWDSAQVPAQWWDSTEYMKVCPLHPLFCSSE